MRSRRLFTQWDRWTNADGVKATVANWARGGDFWPLIEVGGIVDGRLDLVLVPLSIKCPMFTGMRNVVGNRWEATKEGQSYDWAGRLGLAGVEVKVDTQDFKNGLESGQFARYDASLAGLYIAGPRDVVIPKMVPAQYGVLTVSGEHIACRRHPQWKECPLESGQAWRVIWKLFQDFQDKAREAATDNEDYESRFCQRAGKLLAEAIHKGLHNLDGKE